MEITNETYMQPYNINEIIALVTAVAIGSGTYVSFVWKKKLEKITVQLIISVIFISSFITYLAAEVVKIFNLGEYRTIILPPAAFMSQWLVEWISIRYPKIFDAGLKKTTGLDITNNEEEEINNYEQDIQEHQEGENHP